MGGPAEMCMADISLAQSYSHEINLIYWIVFTNTIFNYFSCHTERFKKQCISIGSMFRACNTSFCPVGS